jgi:excisionase family DNA binding protein
MQSRRYLSPHQVSCALGVSTSSVKRWVDDGTLPAQKTAGGHRRILVGDVLRMIQEGNWPHVDLSLLAGGVAAVAPEPGRLAADFYEQLVAGDQQAAQGLILGAHQAGMLVEELADRVIAPAMQRVGHGWAQGALDVYHEHRATQLCLGALQSVRSQLAPQGPEKPLAVGGGPERDHYLLANTLVELTLQENGWRTANVGPNTPIASLRRAMRSLQPRLLWVSCSYLPEAELFLDDYRRLYEEAEQAGVAVAVGGRALTEDIRARMPYTMHGDGLIHLGAFLRHRGQGSKRQGTGEPG